MGLDARGVVSVAELIVYIPLSGISTMLIIKHGIRRIGWIYLLVLSIGKSSFALVTTPELILYDSPYPRREHSYCIRAGIVAILYLVHYYGYYGVLRLVTFVARNAWLPWDSVSNSGIINVFQTHSPL